MMHPTFQRELLIEVNATTFGDFSMSVDGKNVLSKASLAEAVLSVERVSFRTGPYRDQPTRQTDNERPHDPLEGADDPVPAAVFYVNEVRAASSQVK